jgi:DNA adenine methylase
MSKKLTPPLKWHGGKHYLAKWIISHFPTHTHYVEPYFGGGNVLLQKPDDLIQGHSEVANDANGDLMNFWQVLSGDGHEFRELCRVVDVTPLSQGNWEDACHGSGRASVTASVQRALNFFIRYRQSRQGLGTDFATLSRSRTRRGMNEQASAWWTAIDGLPECRERMKRVVLLNDDAIAVIKREDSPHTFFYLDPPYYHETRVTTNDYEHEMTDVDHELLLRTLSGIEGKFLLSGYRSELYDEYAEPNGWQCNEKEIDNKASSKKTKDKKTECLWWNYA